MNIFALDKDPIVAAQLQCDKHIVKMIVESAQMLSTALRVLDGTPTKIRSKSGKRMVTHYEFEDDYDAELTYYKAVHINHPCSIWCRETDSNYLWLWDHFCALCEEYTYRYGKQHKSELLCSPLATLPKNIKKGPLTPFPLAMKSNPECMFPEDPVKSYKLFYQTKQDRFKMAWTKRNVPEWFTIR